MSTCETVKSLEEIPKIISPLGKIILFIDSNVLKHHDIVNVFKNNAYDPIVIPFSANENNKNYETVIKVQKTIVENNCSRNASIIGIGGGITCDVAAFIASTTMRGLPLFLIPTTLLAMADASIGGKTGVNFMDIKNWVGTFYPAQKVIVCLEFLKTLNDAIYSDGMAEIIKHNIIQNKLDCLDIKRMIGRDYSYVQEIVSDTIHFKTTVCNYDPYDIKDRKCLNFGHTFAHAIESASQFYCSHGQSVALGLIAESRLMGLPEISNKIKEANLPIHFKNSLASDWNNYININAGKIYQYMKFDKKNDTQIKFEYPSFPSKSLFFGKKSIVEEINRIID